jgi:integrase
MVLLAGCTGLRVSEVTGLRWAGINFERLVIEIREGRPEPGHELKASLPRDKRRLGFSQPTDEHALRFRFAPKEGSESCGVT